MDDLDVGSPAPTVGPLLGPSGEARLTNQRATPSTHTTSGQPAGGGGASDDETRTVVVQFSIWRDDDKVKFARLGALRGMMHRMLNTAIDEWHRADKVVSGSADVPKVRLDIAKKIPELSASKVTELSALVGCDLRKGSTSTRAAAVGAWLDQQLALGVPGQRSAAARQASINAVGRIEALKRVLGLSGLVTNERGPVTHAVQSVIARERAYWQAQVQPRAAKVQVAQHALGVARAKQSLDVGELEKKLVWAERDLLDAQVRASIEVPSKIYDETVNFTASRHEIYKKESFRGTRSMDQYRAGQPIRWRTGAWSLVAGPARGHYTLTLPLDGGAGVDTFDVTPDGPGMHAYAHRMVNLQPGEKLCDARVTFAEKKGQWFAKLSVTLRRPVAKSAGAGVAALRRGIHNAFVLVFEDGWVESISGDDVLAFKRKIKARKIALQRHMSKMGLGLAARGRGKARRYKALSRIDESEDRFIKYWCERQAAYIAAACVSRGVGRLLVADTGGDMKDGDEVICALLHQWPFARMLDAIKRACEAVPVDDRGRPVRRGGRVRRAPADARKVAVEKYAPFFAARRCPSCGHVHATRFETTFKCEVCSFERPADQIVAWNGLLDAVGKAPIDAAKKATKARGAKIRAAVKGEEEKKP